MTTCEDCGEEVRRRILCYHCGDLVCLWCWHHVHGCGPGHGTAECNSLKRYRKYGRPWIRRLRARRIRLEERCRTE